MENKTSPFKWLFFTASLSFFGFWVLVLNPKLLIFATSDFTDIYVVETVILAFLFTYILFIGVWRMRWWGFVGIGIVDLIMGPFMLLAASGFMMAGGYLPPDYRPSLWGITVISSAVLFFISRPKIDKQLVTSLLIISAAVILGIVYFTWKAYFAPPSFII